MSKKISEDVIQFETRACKNFGIDLDEYRRRLVTLPCDCTEPTCTGHASVERVREIIVAHCLQHIARNWPDQDLKL